uniref:Uncharacterized protein n=1 Tax=Steinernema glaseri TaxID=37863 RepID=A0A1I8AU76_9BILA
MTLESPNGSKTQALGNAARRKLLHRVPRTKERAARRLDVATTLTDAKCSSWLETPCTWKRIDLFVSYAGEKGLKEEGSDWTRTTHQVQQTNDVMHFAQLQYTQCMRLANLKIMADSVKNTTKYAVYCPGPSNVDWNTGAVNIVRSSSLLTDMKKPPSPSLQLCRFTVLILTFHIRALYED